MTRGQRSSRAVSAGAAAVLCALALGAAPPAGGAERPGPLLQCVQQRYGGLRDLSAGFAQESRVASLGRPRSRSGRIFFQAPGRMRWEYAGADPQLIVADGKQIWFYRPERRQVVTQPIDAAFARQTPLLFLMGKGDLAAEFAWEDRELEPGPDGAVSIALRPRAETPDLVRLVLEVVPGQCRLAGTQIEDAFGNQTRLTFSGEATDRGLAPELFRFSPPKGTEVVRP